MKYVSVDEMIAIEKESDARGHTYPEMMEHAGRGLAEVIQEQYRDLPQKKVAALVGSGNNGGDALVALDYLLQWGWTATALILREREPEDPLVERVRERGGLILDLHEDQSIQEGLPALIKAHDVLVDGVLGTGIRLPVRGELGEMLDSVRQVVDDLEEPPHVVAVDCPSGVDTDTGEVDPVCIPADLTVTMAAVKQGLLKFPAFACLGELRVVDIGLPEGLESYTAVRREVVFAEDVLTRLPERPLDGHKGTFGTALILAGSVNYPGASLLAGQAAYCVGTGLVTIAVPEGLHPHLAGHLTEATWLPVPQEGGGFAEEAAAQLVPELTEPTALLMGPGFGKRGQTGRFVDRFLATPSLPTTVLDADGLRLTARLENWPKRLPPRTVLTPHPGEMAALTGLSTADIQADRVGIAERFAREWEHVVVLKGAHTVVADPEGETRIIPIAHSALASAGTGDVLAGVIVGLMAQGLDSFEAAFMGAWLHARAGIIAADQVGSAAAVRAGDVCDALAQACR